MNTEIIEIQYQNKTAEMRAISEQDLMYLRWVNEGMFYEHRLLGEIEKLNLVGSYLDVGANLGNHSVYFGMFCPATSLYCVEMHPKIIEVLKMNLLQNIGTRIPTTIFETAVIDHEGQTHMHGYSLRNPGATSLREDGNAGPTSLTTLDKLMDGVDDVAFIKIDVEGVEFEVIEGARETIKRNRPAMAIEVINGVEKFNLLMKSLGYTTDGVNYAHTPTYLYLPDTK